MSHHTDHSPHHGVAVAVRRQDGRFLLIRRSAAVLRSPLAVCFPGGHVEPGETQPAACIREMHEELGLNVTPGRCVWQHHFTDRNLLLFGWTAQLADSADTFPHAPEVAETLWLTDREAVEHPDALPTVRDFVNAIRAGEAG